SRRTPSSTRRIDAAGSCQIGAARYTSQPAGHRPEGSFHDVRRGLPAAPAELDRLHPLRQIRDQRRHRDSHPDGDLPALSGSAPTQGQISVSAKKKAISRRALSSESEPCTEFASIEI